MNSQSFLRPIAEPQIIEGAFTEDQYQRMLHVLRNEGPWSLILAQEFTSPEQVIATTSGSLPEGVVATWDMFLSPVFRATLGRGHASLFPEIEDCFFNTKFLQLVRDYWKAKYATPNLMLVNIQGPTEAGGPPHVDGADFRGVNYQNSPSWLIGLMTKTGLFRQWQSKKAQVLTWYYKGQIGGGFTYWPDGPGGQPKQLFAPMWGRGAVVENEVMYHGANACGPAHKRRVDGLAINSVIHGDPASDQWQISTDGKVVERLPAEETRLLVHWGADIFMDLDDMSVTLDHSDDLTHEKVFDILISEMRARGVAFKMPNDPLKDPEFVQLLTKVFDPGLPTIMPPEYGMAAE
ncbi:hypothetical protein [Sphingobium sp. Cam5-1]|uniref:hypothetical protein n=1 Tax=Sphingobium sp. Cam5-1 TaxID=2789327 RepID=UPI0018AD11AB|nr:hypothetical protein [Sphingobium sp. Cam5-1]QPI73421.1 hypothetical protein IZV00_02685 [Sphingobium sp. Cam5-1]